MNKITSVTLLSSTLLLASCAEVTHSNSYSINDIGLTRTIHPVYITRVHRVDIDNRDKTARGATLGALAGGIGGALIGNSAHSTAFGALAGGLTGAAIGDSHRHIPGVSINYRNKNGKLHNVIQPGYKYDFKEGPAKEIITHADNGERYVHIKPNRPHYG